MIVACIPARDEEKTVAGVVLRAMRHADEVLVCDDGSKDLTGKIAEKLGARVLKHERSKGYGAALRSLFEEALTLGGDYVVLLDADGQHNPDDIPRLVKPLRGGEADVVIGSRFKGGGRDVPGYRRWGIKTITGIYGDTTGMRVSDAQSGYRAFRASVLKGLMPVEQGMGASVEMLAKAGEQGLKVWEVPIEAGYSGLKPSSENPVLHGLDVLSSLWKIHSIRYPLRLYGGLGLAAIVMGLFFGAWTLQIFFVEGRLVTNLTLVSIGAFLTGFLSLFVGIILFTFITVVREFMEKQ